MSSNPNHLTPLEISLRRREAQRKKALAEHVLRSVPRPYLAEKDPYLEKLQKVYGKKTL